MTDLTTERRINALAKLTEQRCRRLKAELALFKIAMEVGLLKPEDTDSNIKYS